jgi:hypothetical protein
MFRVFIFLHVLSVFIFLLAHGAGVKAMLAIRRERNLERIRSMIELSRSYTGVMYGSFLFILVSGIVGGFLGRWWGKGWIWVSLALLIAITFIMSYFGTQYFEKVLTALGLETYETRKKGIVPKPASPSELEALLCGSHPVLLATSGVGGLVVILWLMMFKPF